MPIYEYQCQACEKVTDFLQKMSDEPMVTCPECNKDTLKKLVSAPRFQLTGSGWYETDFKNSDKKKPSSLETTKSGEANTEDKGETKSSKTESKSETKTATADDGKAA